MVPNIPLNNNEVSAVDNHNNTMPQSAERKAYTELNERSELTPGILNNFRQLIEG